MRLDLSNRGYQAVLLGLSTLGMAMTTGFTTTAIGIAVCFSIPAAVGLTFRAVAR
jgi:hypothetical protein